MEFLIFAVGGVLFTGFCCWAVARSINEAYKKGFEVGKKSARGQLQKGEKND